MNVGNSNIITLDKTYEAKIETVDKFEGSIFRDVYNKASLMICEIISKNEAIEKRKWDSIKGKSSLNNICNVIALMGERGSGKSSALASYQGFLTEFSEREKSDYEYLTGNNRKLVELGNKKKISFITLDIMDATLLDVKENIIEIILARMLEKLEEQERSIRSHDAQSGKYESSQLKLKIGNIYEVMHNKPKEDSWEVEPAVVTLKALSKSWNLRKEFQNLVEEYVKYFENYGKSSDKSMQYYLVISIDDIDVNIMKSYEMLEMIRKYLMVPKVITIMTADYESLTAICKKYYYNELKPAQQCSSDSIIDVKEIENLTNEYLEKVVPTGRKIYMPDLYYTEGFLEKNMLVKNLNNTHIKQDSEIYMRELVAVLLRLYTGVTCITGDYGNQFLYPTSIRKLCNYVKEFRQLELVSCKDSLEMQENNMNWLYADVMNRFLYQNVPDNDIVLVKKFNEIAVKEKINFLVDKIIEKFEEKKKEQNGRNLEIITQKMVWLLGIEEEIKEEREEDKRLKHKIVNEQWIDILEEIKRYSKEDITYCIKLIEVLKGTQLYSRQMIDCISMYFSMMMTRYCFEAQFNVEMRKKMFSSYWPNGCWSKWENEKYGNGKFVLKRGKYVCLARIRNKEVKGFKENIQKGILIYQLTRFFLGKEERKDGNFTWTYLSNDNVILGLDNSREWKICWLNFINYIFNYEDFLKETENEIMEQLEKQQVKGITSDFFVLKEEMKSWSEKQKVRDVVPFYSLEWMGQTLDIIAKYEPMELEARSIIVNILKCFEEQLSILRRALYIKPQLVSVEEVAPFYIHDFRETFITCPIIRYLMEEIDKSEIIREHVFNNLNNIMEISGQEEKAGLEEIIDTEEEIEVRPE